MRLGGILTGLLLTCGFAVQAEPMSTACVPKAEMQAIAQHFAQFKPLSDKDYCYDGSHESHLIAGLMFMRETGFASSMPKSADELFSGRFANDWYQYFIGRIHDIDIQKSCEKGVAAYVFMFGNTMYVCPMLLSDNFTALDRASVMMHEARHIDGFPHMTCTRGARKGMRGACDNKIADGGSYAVTVETYSQIAAYAPNIHPALRAYARAAGVTYADETFENPARVQRQLRLLMLSTQGEFRALDLNGGAIKETSLGQAPALGRISMRAQHMVLYPEDRTQPAKYVFARSEGDIQQAAGDMAVDYNDQTPQQRGEWVDVHVAAQWSAKVLKTKVTLACNPSSDTKSEISTGSETPASMIYPGGYDREYTSAHIAMQSGKIFEVGCNGINAFLKESNMKFDQPYKRIYKAGNDVVGLTQDGRLFRINGSSSTPLQTSLDGRVYELAPNQSVSFLDMN